jgi:orotate phosphoribosyltransferase-like protein
MDPRESRFPSFSSFVRYLDMIAELTDQGLTDKEIAARIDVSEQMVKNHQVLRWKLKQLEQLQGKD